jgi:hypothetical protein
VVVGGGGSAPTAAGLGAARLPDPPVLGASSSEKGLGPSCGVAAPLTTLARSMPTMPHEWAAPMALLRGCFL